MQRGRGRPDARRTGTGVSGDVGVVRVGLQIRLRGWVRRYAGRGKSHICEFISAEFLQVLEAQIQRFFAKLKKGFQAIALESGIRNVGCGRNLEVGA
jgi:hypothetical protein